MDDQVSRSSILARIVTSDTLECRCQYSVAFAVVNCPIGLRLACHKGTCFRAKKTERQQECVDQARLTSYLCFFFLKGWSFMRLSVCLTYGLYGCAPLCTVPQVIKYILLHSRREGSRNQVTRPAEDR